MKMKKVLIWISFLLVSVSLMACSATQKQYAIQSSLIGVESTVLKNQYATVEKLLRDRQNNDNLFTDEEWRKLLNVDATIDMLIQKYDAITALDTANMNLQDVQFMWGLAGEGYTQARAVIMAHWDELQPSTQILLNAFDTQAEMTSTRINELLSDPNNTNINQTLTLIAGVLSIAVKMLGVVAL